MIKAEINKKIGDVDFSFEIQEEKEFDALEKASLFGCMPDECGLCKSKDVKLTSHRAQEYTFVDVVCNECGARAQLGSYKKGGYYWKEWEEKYEKEDSPI